MEQTMTFLCKKSDVPENGVIRVVLSGGKPIAVYNLAGRFFATDDHCSHGDASLAGGFIEGDAIVCPLHFGSFDIRTGMPVDPPCTREIATHALIEDGDDLRVAST